jgi:tRNA-(ms[2]io[6]A)-hydroxylase
MLCLHSPSNPEWIINAKDNIHSILIDHAHCEKKAAANALHLIQHYPQYPELVLEMISIVKEEWEHFEQVYAIILQQNIQLTKDTGDTYAQQLSKNIRKSEDVKLLDLLLVDAIIEARSCERFSILSKCMSIPSYLREFYSTLLASEAGHYITFVDLAKKFYPDEIVKSRLQQLAAIEAKIVQQLHNQPTIHG